jgi:hypothetical protein
VEPLKKGKKGKGRRVVKKRRETAEQKEEDSSLHSGPETEPGKSCCCPPLFRL